LILLVVSVATCTVPGPSEPLAQITSQKQHWDALNIQRYRISVLKVESIWHAQTNTITVQDGQVTDQSATCTPAPFEGRSCEVREFDPNEFTVPGLFDVALKYAPESARNQLRVTFDDKYHYPTTISRDEAEVTDDDVVWRVTSFEILR
jgi:hypothetical protein